MALAHVQRFMRCFRACEEGKEKCERNELAGARDEIHQLIGKQIAHIEWSELNN